MIDGAFAFVPGIGPSREKQLWQMGITSWEDFPASGTVLAPMLDTRLRDGITRMRGLIADAQWGEVARSLPVRDRWRLFPHLEANACYLDIETTADRRVTVIGLYDQRSGPRLYVRGHNLDAFVDEERPVAVITFNGASFDLPLLKETFPGWRKPEVHIDLRNVLRLLDERGGLKAIESRFGLERPVHLQGVSGADAVVDWDAFRQRRDVKALARLLEYNLYDVVQMRSLAEMACERLALRHGRTWGPQHRFQRGDVLLDITRAVSAVTENAKSIDPDRFHDEERRSVRTAL